MATNSKLNKNQAVCESGLIGWKCNLQENYNSFQEFKEFCRVYAIHTRLGYKSMKKAWEENPLIKGSSIPSDLEVIKH